MKKVETTKCSGGECVEIEALPADWFRIRSTAHRQLNLAVTGAELRAFLTQVKAGQFDEIAGLEPDTTVTELKDEIAVLQDALLYDHREAG